MITGETRAPSLALSSLAPSAELIGVMPTVIQAVSSHAGKTYAFIKRYDEEIALASIGVAAIPMLYQHWGAVQYGAAGLGVLCSFIPPRVLPQVYKQVVYYWSESETVKIGLCAAGYCIVYLDPGIIPAIAYGAYVRTSLTPLLTRFAEKYKRAKEAEEVKRKEMEALANASVVSRIWSSLFGSHEHKA